MSGLEIAVIGMAGRFPGAKNIDEYWKNLVNGIETITFFSEKELEENGVDNKLIENPDYIKANGLLEDIEYFDPFFFGYKRIEGELMNPQVRLFHQCAWSALENACYNPWSYKGLIGLYAGASSSFNWEATAYLSEKSKILGTYASSQLARENMMSLRVAYKLNLKGPAFSLYTTCSTSLVAIHLACQGLLSGECDIALAGGVSISIPQITGYTYQEGMIASPDGHCRPFDADAKGTVGANGIGIVVLKRLEDAETDRDNIYAIIKGSSINNDGDRKVGFTAPSLKGQIDSIRSVMEIAEVEPQSIGYFEAHGTGTIMGDPIEIKALTQAFNTKEKAYCGIGSVKSNFGHLDAAAGVAGFIKTVLALKHKVIPPSLHFKKANPQLDLHSSPFYVVNKLSKWKNNTSPRQAGISSLGMGGTNAHIIIEEAPQKPTPLGVGDSRPHQLLILSAQTPSALNRMNQNIAEYLKKEEKINLADVAYSLQVGRKAFPYRQIVISPTHDPKLAAEALINSPQRSLAKEERPIIFMFPGQGSQYVNMGLDLYKTGGELEFRKQIDRCFEILTPLMETNLKDILYPPNSNNPVSSINQTELTQPLLFIFEYSLAKQLIKWGIKPQAMIGHSIGEYTAACLAGVLSLEDALKMIVLRGELMQKMPKGCMLSVSLSKEEVTPLLEDPISLAAVNSPKLCVVSGPHKAIDHFASSLQQKEIKHRKLYTSHAFHSKMMDPILETFKTGIKNIKFNKPRIPYISNISGKFLSEDDISTPDYWVKHLRQTVEFSAGIKELLQDETPLFIEVGPGRTLSTFVKQHKADNQKLKWSINLIKHPDETIADNYYLLNKLGNLWLAGVKIDWEKFHSQKIRNRLPLPGYSFDKVYCWIDKGQISLANNNIYQDQKQKQDHSLPSDEFDDEFQNLNSNTPYVPPQNKIQKIMVRIWSKLFSIERIGIKDDFFEFGGDSLQAMAVSATIYKELNVKIPIQFFFANPTIEKLAAYAHENLGRDSYTSIKPVEKKEYYPLSPPQQRMLFMHKKNPDSLHYNLHLANELRFEINKKTLEDMFKKLIERHESLRTSFHLLREEPIQKIHPQVDFNIEYFEPALETQLGEDLITDEKIILDQTIRKFLQPFNLEKAPLLRAALIKTTKDDKPNYVMVVDMHHIITDGASLAIIYQELALLALETTLPPLKLHYKDYTEWFNQAQHTEWMKEQERYWLKIFESPPPILNLPTDFERPEIKIYEGSYMTKELDNNKVEKIRTFLLEKNVTLSIMLLSVYNIFLSKLSGLEDIVLLTVLNGRNQSELNNVIGMFANTLFYRNYPSRDKKYIEFLKEVKNRVLDAYENQNIQADVLVEKVETKRDPGRNPISDVSFMLLNEQGDEDNNSEASITTYDYQREDTLFDFGLTVIEKGKRILLRFGYSVKLFKKETVLNFMQYFEDILNQILDNQDIKLKDIQIDHNLLNADSNVPSIIDFDI